MQKAILCRSTEEGFETAKILALYGVNILPADIDTNADLFYIVVNGTAWSGHDYVYAGDFSQELAPMFIERHRSDAEFFRLRLRLELEQSTKLEAQNDRGFTAVISSADGRKTTFNRTPDGKFYIVYE